MKTSRKKENRIILFTVLLCCLLIYVGNKIAMKDMDFFNKENDLITAKAEVTKVLDENANEYGAIIFECKVLEGERQGEVIRAGQTLDPNTAFSIKTVEKGDIVYLGDATEYEIGADWFLYEYERFNGIVWLGAAFGILLLLFGRSKGLRTYLYYVYGFADCTGAQLKNFGCRARLYRRFAGCQPDYSRNE